MPFGLGAGESLLLIPFLLLWLAPIIATIWALVTLAKVKRGQDEIMRVLASIERRLP